MIAMDATSVLTAAWTEITAGISVITGDTYALLGIVLLPLAGKVLGITKGLWRGRRR